MQYKNVLFTVWDLGARKSCSLCKALFQWHQWPDLACVCKVHLRYMQDVGLPEASKHWFQCRVSKGLQADHILDMGQGSAWKWCSTRMCCLQPEAASKPRWCKGSAAEISSVR